MGFSPNWTGDASTVEYVKDYADTGNRLARLSCVFSKQSYASVMDQARLMQFVVTVTASVDPAIEEIEQRAPPVLRPDMLRALEALEGIKKEPPPETGAECSLCGMELEEWTVDDDGRVTCYRPDLCDRDDDSDDS